MKIREILAEVEGYQQGKAAMTKLLNPDQWDISPSYDKGKGAVNKVLTPSRWFGGKGSTKQQSSVEPYQMRQSLINAGSGKTLYHDDIAALKSAYNDAEDAATQKAIKMAYKMQTLSKEQQQLLIAQSKRY